MLSNLLLLAGLALVITGISLVYTPAAVIAGGLACLFLAFQSAEVK